jgi:hypothetical protein
MIKSIKSRVAVLGLLSLIPLHAAQPDAAAIKALIPTQEQIDTVAALLPAKPIGVGCPITDREAWATAMQQPYFQKQLKDADLYATQPIPDLGELPTNNYWINRDAFEMRTKRLIAFVIAECAQNDGKHLPLIEAELQAILTERTWSEANVNQIDLAVAARGWTVATVDYWLGDKLKPETRQLIRSELHKRVLDKYEADFKSGDPKWGWEIGDGSNWIPVCNSGVLGVALTIIDSPQERAFFVQTAQNSVAYYLKGLGDDGYCFEGVGYWGYGFGCYLCMAEMLYDQTQGKINMFQGDKVRNLALYLRRMQMLPGVYAAWGDVWYRGNGAPEELYELINERWGMGWTDLDPSKSTMFATHICSDRLFGFGIFGFPRPQFGDSMVAGAPALPDEALSNKLRYFFPNGNALITRSERPGAPDLGLAVKAGNNGAAGGHSHNDNGTYFVATHGVPLVIDPGMEIYTRDSFGPHRFESMINNSYGHGVPYVGGTLQKAGVAAQAVITNTSFTDDKDSITIDLTTSYDVPALIKLTRTYTLDRTKPSVEITDTADFSAPTDYGSALITAAKWQEKGPGSFLIYEEKGTSQAAVEATVTLEGNDATLVNKVEPLKAHQLPRSYQPMRLGFNLDKPVTHVVMHTVIVPIPPPTWKEIQAFKSATPPATPPAPNT